MAKETEIPEPRKFTESLEKHQHGLISYCFYPINTASIEAHNYTISSLRRNARGFHDNDYSKLKFFQAINLRDRS